MLLLLLCTGIGSLYGQVELNSGAATFTLPIFDFSDPKSSLKSKVQLAYSSGNGLKINDVASDAGLGWHLEAGGSIQRLINGEPDDQNSTSLFPPYTYSFVGNGDMILWDQNEKTNYFPNGYMYSEHKVYFDANGSYEDIVSVPQDMGCIPTFAPGMDRNYKTSRRSQADREQDIFIYNAGETGGSFYIGKNKSILQSIDNTNIVTFGEQNMISDSIRTRINGFQVKTSEGIIYKFNDLELVEVITENEAVAVSEGQTANLNYLLPNMNSGNSTIQPSTKYVVSKWYLSEIVNPLTNEKIIFEYDTRYVNQLVSVRPLKVGTKITLIPERHKGKIKILKQIVYPNNHKVNFRYANHSRYDFKGSSPLSAIEVFFNNQLQSSFDLETGYFRKNEIQPLTYQPTNEIDENYLRLALKKITPKGNDGTISNPYEFNYYTGTAGSANDKDIVPSRMCMEQDFYGYYNKGMGSAISLPANDYLPKDLPYSTYNNLLYGGSFRSIGTDAARNGCLKSVVLPAKGRLEYEYEQNRDGVTSNTYESWGIRVKNIKSFTGDGSSPSMVKEYQYTNEDGSSSAWGYEYGSNTFTHYNSVRGDNGGHMQGSQILSYMYKGIKLGISAVKTSVKGIVSSSVASNVTQFKQGLTIFIIMQFINSLQPIPVTTTPVQSLSYYPNWANNAIGLQYARVTEKTVLSGGGGNGKTVYEFTKPLTSAEIKPNNAPFSQKQRLSAWRYGLPLKTIWYDEQNNKKREIENTYDFIERESTDNNFRSGKVMVQTYTIQPYHYVTYNTPEWTLIKEFYYPRSGRSELKMTKERNYSGAQYSEDIVNYYYDSRYLLTRMEKTRSNGTKEIIKNHYTYSFASIPGVQELQQQGIDKLIIQETWLKKDPQASEVLKSSDISYYGPAPANRIALLKKYGLDTELPVPESVIGQVASNSSSLVRNPAYLKERADYTYDSKGNTIQEYRPEQAVSMSTFMDDDAQAPAATVVNAAYNEVAYSSFESANQGNWIYSANAVREDVSITGKKCFSFQSNNTSLVVYAPMAPGKEYKLSFWSKNGAKTFSLSLPAPKQGPTVSGWTYFEYTIPPQPANTWINIYGQGEMDELRLYPANARMASVAYGIFGKTAACDENNRIEYYEYDSFGRLAAVKDQQRNLIKAYKYNQKN